MPHLCNLGHHERVIRVGIGIILLAIGGFSFGPEWGNLIFLVVGFVALLTGIVVYCPAWHLRGLSTCQRSQHSTEPQQAPKNLSSH